MTAPANLHATLELLEAKERALCETRRALLARAVVQLTSGQAVAPETLDSLTKLDGRIGGLVELQMLIEEMLPASLDVAADDLAARVDPGAA